jgi:diacylglycerol kinase family enzyme
MAVTGATVASIERPRPEAGPAVVGPARSARKKRMLIIVNPYATTVSDRLKNLVVYALQGRYQVEAVSTQAQNHATQICREAREEGYDVVVAFGGDGTLNEVANGLAGTDVPVSVLPGGSTNVVARTLGIPNDVVDATEHLLELADRFEPRAIDLGTVNERRFVFACGAGLDATAARRVDANPRLKARAGRWFYTWATVSGFYSRYLRDPIRMRVEVDGAETSEGVTALAQNSDPFTYFGAQPLRVCENAAIDNGTLSLAVLRRATQRDLPTIAARALAARLRVPDHRHIDQFDGVTAVRIESISTDREGRIRPIPVQVDGDYIGDHGELDLGIEPGALMVVA